MIGTASKINIDAIEKKYTSTRLKQDIGAIENREHAGIRIL